MRALALLAAALTGGCAVDDMTTATEQAASVYQWTDDVQIAGQASEYQVGLAMLGDKVHMVHTNGDNPTVLASRLQAGSWSAPLVTGMAASYGPALTVWRNQLVAVYHQAGQNRLMMSTSLDGSYWTTPVTAGTSLYNRSLNYAPAAIALNGRLYVAYCETDGFDKVRIDTYDGTTWWQEHAYSVEGYQCKGVAFAVLPDGRIDLIYDVYYAGTSSTWHMYEAIMDGTLWSNPTLLAMKSKKPPALVTCGGLTHMVHGGYSTPDEIWWTTREGGHWNGDVRVPDQASHGGAALGCYQNTTPVMVHNGGYDQLWWSEYL